MEAYNYLEQIRRRQKKTTSVKNIRQDASTECHGRRYWGFYEDEDFEVGDRVM